ncbi:MAG: trypsin-like peptidase domain-containing protein [Patescibacteria group bacterium]|nr:trypsin-like peptidase domain-containing protein [Patescibacteria group bacterium]
MFKKVLIPIIIAGLISGIIGSSFPISRASASFFDDILNFLKGAPETTNPLPNKLQDKNNDLPKPIEPQIDLYKPVAQYEDAVVGAVELASPSVVSIVITKDLPVIEQCPYDPFGNLPPEFRDFFGGGFGFQFQQPCQKGIKKQEVGGGTGFIISEDGLVLTNKHVVADAKAEYTVLTNDEKKYNAKVLARDPVQDLAVLKIDALGLRAAKLGDSSSVKLGQTAIAIGNALGEYRNTVSVGVISGLARKVTASGVGFGTETISGVIQTDAAINLGNSGGPLLNLRGEVIGINTAMASGAQSIGFAIPINNAKRAINSVKTTGSIKIPFIGVRYIFINEEIAKKQKLPVDYGALVRGAEDGPAVVPDSPAAKAGVQAEDIILEVNSEKIEKNKTLSDLIQKYNIGDVVIFKIRRGNNILNLNIKLGERPSE